jgi:hypothetical protein
LLILVLKGLSGWQARVTAENVRLLSVSALGPRRSVEALRYGDEVLLVYRSEGAMVLIDRMPATDYESQHPPRTDKPLRERLADLLRPRR